MSSNSGFPQGNYDPMQPAYPYGSSGTTQYGGYPTNPYSIPPPPPPQMPRRTNRLLILLIVVLIFVVALSVSGFIWAVTKLTATGGISPQATTTTAITPTVVATQPVVLTTPVTQPTPSSPQEIDIPTGSSASVLVGDCVDTWQFANIHAQYSVVFDKTAWKRVKITEAGSVDGKATIYRNSPCNSTP